MIAVRIPYRAKVGKTDRFYVDIDASWLGSASITGATVATASGFLSIGAIDYGVASAVQIGFYATGLAAGDSVLDIDFTTSDGRSDCKHVKIDCIEC